MRHEKIGVLVAVLLAAGAVRCSTGTETDNPVGPVKSFGAMGCHGPVIPKDGPPPMAGTGAMGGVAPQSAAPEGPPRVEEDARYNNLHCITWSRDDGDLLFRVRNLNSGCGIHFTQGDARIDGNEVALGARNPECMRTACGMCTYDMEWTVEDVPMSGDLDVSFVETDEDAGECERPLTLSYVIPEGEPEGERCSFMEYPRPSGSCTVNAGCVVGELPPGSTLCTCVTGSVCFSAEEPTAQKPLVGGRCLSECTADSDCPLPASFTCERGLCQPKPW